MARMASELIKMLYDEIQNGGDRPVYYADPYDHAMSVNEVEAVDAEGNGWEGEPENEPYIALS